MKRTIRCMMITLISMAISMMGLQVAKADSQSNKVQENDIGFSVSAKIPKNQINSENSYFDLKMDSNKKQTLQVTIYNTTNQDMKIENAIHTAYTNDNGVIEYVTPGHPFDGSLKYKMSDITRINGPKIVTVPANGSKVVSAKVKIPQTKFDGVLLGGWYFKRTESKVTGTVKNSMSVTNQYSYVIGLKYLLGHAVNPTLKLGNIKVGMRNYHRGIIASLRNTAAVIVPGLRIKTMIVDRDDHQVVVRRTKRNVQLAPNSVFNYPLLLGQEKLKSGYYHMQMLVSNNIHEWKFEKNFHVSEASAKKYNQQSVDDNGINMLWIVGTGLIVIVVILLLLTKVYLYRRRH